MLKQIAHWLVRKLNIGRRLTHFAHESQYIIPVIGLPIMFGGNFKEYIARENMPEKIAALKIGLTPDAIKELDKILYRMQTLPNRLPMQSTGNYQTDWLTQYAGFYLDMRRFCDAKELTEIEKFCQIKSKQLSELSLPEGVQIGGEVLVYHNGLSLLPEKVRQYIKDKAFIDVGGYVGDSTLMFRKYNPGKIYSFELSEQNRKIMQNVLDLNHVDPSEYEIVPCGLGPENTVLNYTDTGGGCVTSSGKGDSQCQMVTLDSFASEKDLKVGVIKMDIEGFELSALKGMLQTIQKHRPVLSFAIYHNPEQFFETKPLLDQYVKNYYYSIRQLVPFNGMLDEVTLVAYPQEIA